MLMTLPGGDGVAATALRATIAMAGLTAIDDSLGEEAGETLCIRFKAFRPASVIFQPAASRTTYPSVKMSRLGAFDASLLMR